MSVNFKDAYSNEAPPLKHAIRFVSAASLFDGHDAAINVMRRILQRSGSEVIHLGHNRSVHEIVSAAIQEDAQGIAISSYQGGHVEFFKYARDLLDQRGASHIQIFGGGGGVIVPEEIAELHAYGITKIFSPEDGRELGLQGMINAMLKTTDIALDETPPDFEKLKKRDPMQIARAITFAEMGRADELELPAMPAQVAKIIGITGTGGAGKSSLSDEFIRRYLMDYPEKTLGVICVDPTRKRGGGALLGDRIRMNAVSNDRVYMRSLATRKSKGELSAALDDTVRILKSVGFDLILIETSGIGQGDADIVEHCDIPVYVMTASFGAQSQLEKIDMLDFADAVVVNKFEKAGSEDAIKAVRKQYRRNRGIGYDIPDEDLPIYGTIASQFNDSGVNAFFHALMKKVGFATNPTFAFESKISSKQYTIIPPSRVRYLAEISETCRDYRQWTQSQGKIATRLYRLLGAKEVLDDEDDKIINTAFLRERGKLEPSNFALIEGWNSLVSDYMQSHFQQKIRDKVIEVELSTQSLSGTRIPKVSLPKIRDWGDILEWQLLENVPGRFPFTAGVFEFKRKGEDPKRMFAGEGTPDRTNKRFHYLCAGEKAKRLSTAFDSVTLYGEDPDERPDIYGKIGNSGVNVCTLDDMKRLYEGFDLSDKMTSVSMTINGPAPIILAMYLNSAIDQNVDKFTNKNQRPPTKKELQDIFDTTLKLVRGTVQADILKEDQAQNTCIFSTDFALKMMGDIQEYFVKKEVRNYYSVSISGYHIAEAGANPITQLAFTLANGFTFVEYYLSRGLDIDSFAPNLSFFFSNGMDPEYAVLGRVARRIWSVAMKKKYKANERSQKLKYHIQTSGRSLHAQEVDFNDIRTTLQALLAYYDNCNSLHTNAYDEAITTPTESSVRRAVAIQLIIAREFGVAKNENPTQGAFLTRDLTDLVEEAVLCEFEAIASRGGVLGAMETQYQRNKIQDESILYEMKKHSGEIPIIGVNTYLLDDQKEAGVKIELIRSTDEEKKIQLKNLDAFKSKHRSQSAQALESLRQVALSGENIFAELMNTVKFATLGEITNTLYTVGGQYRRAM